MTTRTFRPDVDALAWRGAHSPYDIVREGTIALVVVALLTVTLAVVFGSPDERAITIKAWSNAEPIDFARTAFSELNGTSLTARYGAPYNHGSPGQSLGPLTLAKWTGVRVPVNTARDFVVDPLKSLPDADRLTKSLFEWTSASRVTRHQWLQNYSRGLTRLRFKNGQLETASTNAGPVTVMMRSLTQMARSGALDQALITQTGFYTTNYTLPLLFLSNGTYLNSLAEHQHLSSTQWGMMNETGNYPGQPWMWLYTFWYQIPPFRSTGNADVLVWALMMTLTLALALTPFLPGIRSLPRRSRVYRLIWREHYRSQAATSHDHP